MTEQVLTFICGYADCQKETTVIVTATNPLATQSKSVPVLRYCEHCNRANRIEVPDNVDAHRFILGKDKGFLGYTSEGFPCLQGEQYP